MRALAGRARLLAALMSIAALATLAAVSLHSPPAQAAPSCDAPPVVNGGAGDVYAADELTSTGATLSAHVDTSGYDTDYHFVVYDHAGTAVVTGSTQVLPSGASGLVEISIAGLTPGQSYYFDVTAKNLCGSNEPNDPQVAGVDYGSFQTRSRVDVVIDGEGSVSSSGGDTLSCVRGTGMTMGSTCSADYGSSITLNASPPSGALFLGWSGECNTTSTTCTVTRQGAATVIAHFGWTPLLNVVMAGPGSGRVTSSPGGIACVTGTATGCSAPFGLNSTVTLTAVPDPGSMFVGWGSDETSCTSSAPTCTKKLSTSTYVTANFAPAFELVVSVDSGSGSGTITSVPAGINCPGICNAYYPAGTEVELTATAKPSSTFVGWDGACFDRSPLAPCSLVITGDTELNAEFSNPLIDAAGGGAVVKVNQSRNGQTVRMHRGDLLLLSLPANKSTGFGWHLRALDRKALKLMHAGYVDQTPKAAPALGVPGTYTLSLKALKKSKTALKLSYSRAGGKAVRSFKLNVVVR